MTTKVADVEKIKADAEKVAAEAKAEEKENHKKVVKKNPRAAFRDVDALRQIKQIMEPLSFDEKLKIMEWLDTEMKAEAAHKVHGGIEGAIHSFFFNRMKDSGNESKGKKGEDCCPQTEDPGQG
jgi:uncharacterized protein (DUF111 family)